VVWGYGYSVSESRKNTSPYPFGSKFCRLLACVVDEDEAHLEACQALLEDSVRRPASGNDVCQWPNVRITESQSDALGPWAGAAAQVTQVHTGAAGGGTRSTLTKNV
jgi:hypothetical protein